MTNLILYLAALHLFNDDFALQALHALNEGLKEKKLAVLNQPLTL